MKKYIGIIVCFIMLLAAVAMGSYAAAADIVESGECGENVTYTLDSDGVLTINGSGEMKDYWHDDSPFYNNESIKKVNIKKGVTSVGNYAFYECKALMSVAIPDSVISIGCCAFHQCSKLSSMTIPKSVTTIGYHAFSGCSGLGSVAIPDSVISIDYEAFASCSGLTQLTISNSLLSIGHYVFSGCSGLTSVTIPNGVTSISDNAFSRCSSLTSVIIPNSMISIGERAFDNCWRLTSVIIPDSVKSIANSAFPSSTIIFGRVGSCAQQFAEENDMIFEEEESCTSGHTWDKGKITKESTTNSKGAKVYTCKVCGDTKTEYLFKDEYLIASGSAEDSKWYLDKDGTLTITGNGITIPASFCVGDFNDPGDWYDLVNYVTSLIIDGEYAFIGDAGFRFFNNLEKLEISGVKSIEGKAFFKCNRLISVIVGRGVYIGTVSYCDSLTTVIFGKDIKILTDSALRECHNLENVVFESGDVRIMSGAFSWCGKLQSITFGAGGIYLAEGAFSSMHANVIIPEGKNVVCEDAFNSSSAVVHFLGDLPELRGELNTAESGKVICYYPCSNDTWNTRLPRTAEWRVEHTFGEWESINNNTQHQRICTKDPTHIEVSDHEWDEGVITTAVTCTSAGTKTFTCGVCGFIRTESIEALGHNYSEWRNLNETQHQRICANEASHTEIEEHVWVEHVSEEVPEPFDEYEVCVADSWKYYTCSVCGARKSEKVPAPGHKLSEWIMWNDEQHQKICTVCNTRVEMSDHEWDSGAVTTPATCTDTGTKTYTCSVCGATKTAPIDATGHNYGEWAKLDDEHHQRVCANDASHAETADHVWNDGEITKKPTADVEGEKTFVCTVCGAVKTETVPKLIPAKEDHTPGDVDGNGQVLANDARLALRASAKLETLDERQQTAADVDGSGDVLADDARQILRFSAKLQNEFVKK